ncbi:MAG: bifunctional DNA primase/polymerase [Pseudomonadota bacterium]
MQLSSNDFAVRIGRDEIGRILNLKENVDHNGLWLDFVARYQGLGWVLAATNARGGADLGLDFSQPSEVWSQRLADLGMENIQVNVGIRTGKSSRLLVLEVNKGEGALSLDQLGEWRAECVAEVGDSREQHYYVLPPERLAPPSFFLAPQVLIYGDGGLVLAPPSIEPQGREPWRWRRPPWENPPQAPKAAVWQFIRNHAAPASDPAAGAEPQVLPWEEIYPIIAPYGLVLKALLVPAPSVEAYYYGVLTAARGVGITDPEVLLGLLWHAPHGDCRTRPGRWEYLQDLVADAHMPQMGANGQADLQQAPGLPAAIATLGTWSFPENAWKEVGLHLQPGFRGGDPGSGAAADGYDTSVSGQFFQLLAGLGEKVIVESCRYEALRSELGTRVAAADSRKQEWNQRYCPPLTAPTDREAVRLEKDQVRSSDLAQAWAAVMPGPAPQSRHYQEIQAAAEDFLKQHADLAADRQRIMMVIFCLKNYIAINPEFAPLPFREKLEKAGKMARGFLWEQEPSLEVS